MSEFEALISKASKDWKAPHMMEGPKAPRGKKIPFSSPLLNWATYGGIPRYKITEFYGEYGGGKSTTCLDLCKNSIALFQQEWEDGLIALRERGTKEAKLEIAELEDNGPQKVLYIDLEHSFDSKWAKTLGIDMDTIQVMQPPDISAEKLLELVLNLVKTGEAGLIIVDSLPSLVTEAELDKKMGEKTVASVAGLLTVFSRKIIPLLTRYGSTLVLINQMRDNFATDFKDKTVGGRAVPYYASLRIKCMIGNPIDILGNELPQKTEDPAGYKMKVRIMKQKSAPFDRKNASYYLLCDTGIAPEMDYAQLALNSYGIIKKSAAWFTVCDPYTGEIEEIDDKPVKLNGMAKVYDFLSSNPEYFDKLKKFIEDDINGVEDDLAEAEVIEDAVSDDASEGADA